LGCRSRAGFLAVRPRISLSTTACVGACWRALARIGAGAPGDRAFAGDREPRGDHGKIRLGALRVRHAAAALRTSPLRTGGHAGTMKMMHKDIGGPMVKHAAGMEWDDSPSPSVKRKRLWLFGAKESGRVVSVVKYLPDATFHEHQHPEGEEILVLEGTFSDESGDYPAGSFMLNPEGFAHAPRSKEGCILFVKLRLYPGVDRRKVRIDTTDQSLWQEKKNGVQQIELYSPQEGEKSQEHKSLARIDPASSHTVIGKFGIELFVVSGAVKVTGACTEELGCQSWLSLGPNSGQVQVKAISTEPATIYVKSVNALVK